MSKKKSLIAYLLFTILIFSTVLSSFFIAFAAITVTDAGKLGTMDHYNGIIFSGHQAYQADVEGALAIGGESHLGINGQYDAGASYNKYNSTVTIGVYTNPNNYPTLLVNGPIKVGRDLRNDYINIYGGPVVINGNYENQLDLGNLKPQRGLEYASPSIVNDFFADSYKTAKRVSNAMSKGVKGDSARFTSAQLRSGALNSTSPSNVLAGGSLNTNGVSTLIIEIVDEGHVQITEPKIPASFGNYQAIIFNFPNASSATFTGGSLQAEGKQINTSAPAGAWADQHALLQKYAEKVIWNFPEAETIQISSHGIVGSVIAPDADVFANGGSINGMLIADYFEQKGGMELHAFKFRKGVFDFTAEGEPGSIIVTKVDADNNDIKLSGVEFKIEKQVDSATWDTTNPLAFIYNDNLEVYEYDDTGDPLASEILKTDDSGRFTAIGLPQNENLKYRLVEVTPKDGYRISTNLADMEFTIDEGNGVYEPIQIQVENSSYKTDLLVYKWKADEYGDLILPPEGLEDAKFVLFRWMQLAGETEEEVLYDAVQVGDFIRSDADGKVLLKDLEPGIYYLGEIEAPEDHEINEDCLILRIEVKYDPLLDEWDFTYNNWTLGKGATPSEKIWPYFITNSDSSINYGQDIYGFANPEDTYSTEHYNVMVTKVDAENENIPLAGAEFKLYHYDPSGDYSAATPIQSGTTSSLGYIYFVGLTDGTYVIHESGRPDGYEYYNTTKTNGEPGWVDGWYEFTLPNDLIMGLPGDLPGGGLPPGAMPGSIKLEPDDILQQQTDSVSSNEMDVANEGGNSKEDLPATEAKQQQDPLDEADTVDSSEEESAVEEQDFAQEQEDTKAEVFAEENTDEMEEDTEQGLAMPMSSGRDSFTVWYEEEKEEMLYSLYTGSFEPWEPDVESEEEYEETIIDLTEEDQTVEEDEAELIQEGEEQGAEPDADGEEEISAAEEPSIFTELEEENPNLIQRADGELGGIMPFGDPPSSDPPISYSLAYMHIVCKNENTKGRLTIEKTDSITGLSLAGAVFEISQSDFGGNKVIAQVTTDNNGKATIELPYGRYFVTELKAPEGYKIDSHVEIIYIEETNNNGHHIYHMENEPITTKATLIKVDGTDKTYNTYLAGAEFRLEYFDRGDRQWKTHPIYSGTYITGADGKLTPNSEFDLSVGIYKLIEVTPPTGYELNQIFGGNEVIFSVAMDASGSQIIEMGNVYLTNYPVRAKADLKVIKADSGNAEKTLSGAVFNLYTYEDNGSGSTNLSDYEFQIYRQRLQTDSDGTVEIEELNVGNYALYEVQAPVGYTVGETLEERITPFKVDTGSSTSFIIEMQPITIVNDPGDPDTPEPPDPPDPPDPPEPETPGTPGGGGNSGGGSDREDKYPNDRIVPDPDPKPQPEPERDPELTGMVENASVSRLEGNENPDTGRARTRIITLMSVWFIATGALVFRLRRKD